MYIYIYIYIYIWKGSKEIPRSLADDIDIIESATFVSMGWQMMNDE